MELLLERKELNKSYTSGTLSIDGKYFCATLEDTNRDLNKNGKFDGAESKIYGETCIPFGTYEVIVTMSNKFKRELPLLLNVPHFEGIRIHRGNYTKDSYGCILVGEKCNKGVLSNSTPYEIKLTSLIKEAINKKEKVTIKII